MFAGRYRWCFLEMCQSTSYIATSFHLEADNLEYEPFGMGGTIRMYDLFGDEMDTIIQELNEALAA